MAEASQLNSSYINSSALSGFISVYLWLIPILYCGLCKGRTFLTITTPA